MTTLHYLIGAQANYSVAHCLDLDLVATGLSIDEAIRRLDILVRCHRFVGGIFNLRKKDRAPKKFWRMFEDGTPYDERILDLDNPSIEVIEPAEAAQLQIELKKAA